MELGQKPSFFSTETVGEVGALGYWKLGGSWDGGDPSGKDLKMKRRKEVTLD